MDKKGHKKWTEIDRYIVERLVPSDPALEAALHTSQAAGPPPINVSPNQGKLLMVLAQAVGARAILEIGTLGGYSTIWLARALAPGGRLITLEANPMHLKIARANVARAGLDDRVDMRLGLALDLLPTLATEGPFDFIYIDADQVNSASGQSSSRVGAASLSRTMLSAMGPLSTQRIASPLCRAYADSMISWQPNPT